VLGYNFPGDPWYAEAYKLLTANNLKPAVEPLKAGNKKNFLDRLTQDKDATLAPPGETKAKKGGLKGVLGM
jgi:outer membrane protein assembly factor BamD